MILGLSSPPLPEPQTPPLCRIARPVSPPYPEVHSTLTSASLSHCWFATANSSLHESWHALRGPNPASMTRSRYRTQMSSHPAFSSNRNTGPRNREWRPRHGPQCLIRVGQAETATGDVGPSRIQSGTVGRSECRRACGVDITASVAIATASTDLLAGFAGRSGNLHCPEPAARFIGISWRR